MHADLFVAPRKWLHLVGAAGFGLVRHISSPKKIRLPRDVVFLRVLAAAHVCNVPSLSEDTLRIQRFAIFEGPTDAHVDASRFLHPKCRLPTNFTTLSSQLHRSLPLVADAFVRAVIDG